jgi:hypothetical protein
MRVAFGASASQFGAVMDLGVLGAITLLLLGIGGYLFSKIQL